MRKGWIGIGLIAIGLSFGASAAEEQIITVNPVILKDSAQKKDVILRVIVPAKGGKVPEIGRAHV